MTRFVAVAAALLAVSTAATGCLIPGGCGVADDYDKGTDGTWLVTRLLTGADQCPAYADFEQMTITIAGEQVTVVSAGMALETARVYQVDDRQLVDITVDESWSVDGGGPVSAPMTYSFELVPATARLEGTVASSFSAQTATCTIGGTASAGRVAE